jgi:hypothetical protein
LIRETKNKMPFFSAKVFLGLTIISLLLNGCSDPVSYKEISRTTSPDSVVDAVIIESDAGATTSFAYSLYIVPKGGNFKKGYESFISDHIDGLRVFWKQDRFLIIEYNKGRVFKFQNFWETKELQNFRYVVEIRLVPKTESFSLSEEDRRLKY